MTTENNKITSKYKVHLIITNKDGLFKKLACNRKGEQDMTHDIKKVTCSYCIGKVNINPINPTSFPYRKDNPFIQS